MRIAFFGGKELGCKCLQHIIDSNEKLVTGFVNDNDTAVNRWYPSATEIALKNNIPIFSWKNVNCNRAFEILKSMKPDIIFVVFYDQILKRDIIKLPKYGCINLHNALAEKYRGCYATTWNIINEEKSTGVTLHYIDENIDSGPIIAQSSFEIEDFDTSFSLYKKCIETGFKLFKENFKQLLRGEVKTRAQNNSSVRYYKREFPSQEIDFSKSGKEIRNHIRACLFEPFQRPYFYLGKDKYEVKKCLMK